MTSLAASGQPSATQTTGKVVHPVWVRVCHWTNAVAMVVMVMSGWQIYNASPLFNFVFPPGVTLGGWLGGGLLWHFAAMWLLTVNGLVYVILGLATGRFRRRLTPVTAAGVMTDARAALTGRLRHDDPARYNHLQKLFYAGILIVGALVVLSGLSIWKPVQFQYLTALFGGYDTARYVHFFAMSAIVLFTILHTVMALLVPKSLRAMLIGR
jgi:thiosulfate reductase cytochrome b subunit